MLPLNKVVSCPFQSRADSVPLNPIFLSLYFLGILAIASLTGSFAGRLRQEKTLESPLDCKEINQSILKEISPGCSLEGLMLKLKLQYFGHLM